MSHYLFLAGSLVLILGFSCWYATSLVDTDTEDKGQGKKN